MDLELILISIAIGIAVEAPLGAVNLIVIRATLRSGLPGGLFAAIGSVAGETAFAIAVAFGLRGIGNIILRYGLLLQIVGGVILLAMGIRAFRSHVAEGALRLGPVPRTSLARKALSAFVLTITNPATFMGMVAIFGGLGAMLHLPSSGERPWLAVMGVAIGSSAWWLFVTSLVTHLRDRLAGSTLDKLNHWTGVGIIGFALAIFANVILRFA